MKTCAAALLALGLLMASAARAEEDCRLHIMATLPMTVLDSGRVTVPVGLGGETLPFLVDTGAPSSLITKSAVERLGLDKFAIPASFEFRMFGGEELHSYVRTKNFEVGGMMAKRAKFLVMSDRREDFDGLLGWDFLSQFDVDFDFANGKINLFKPHPCEGKTVYWTQDESAIAKIPFRTKDTWHIYIPVMIDGKETTAIIDTGASHSVMNLETAESLFGIDENSQGVRLLTNPEDPVYTYPFKTLVFEGVTVNNPRIGLYPRSKSRFRDRRVLLGISVLQQLHLFVAFREKTLYITAADKH